MANRVPYGRLVAAVFVLTGCWDSVATPIRIVPDGGSLGAAGTGGTAGSAGEGPRDAGPPSAPTGDVPPTRHCEPVADWPDEAAAAELALFYELNELRREGRSRCAGPEFNGLPPLRLAPALRCSARLHSRDMVTRGFFDTINPDYETKEQRVAEAGYRFRWVEESIMAGGTDYAQVLENLRRNPEDCGHVFDPDLSAVGIGLSGDRWTLDYAGP